MLPKHEEVCNTVSCYRKESKSIKERGEKKPLFSLAAQFLWIGF